MVPLGFFSLFILNIAQEAFGVNNLDQSDIDIPLLLVSEVYELHQKDFTARF